MQPMVPRHDTVNTCVLPCIITIRYRSHLWYLGQMHHYGIVREPHVVVCVNTLRHRNRNILCYHDSVS